MFRIKKWSDLSLKEKIAGSAVLIIIILFLFGSITSSNTSKTTTVVTQQSGIEKFNIEVKSQIVKKVDSKYRYFFDIRNQDSTPFEGQVTINLFTNESKSSLAEDTFNTKQAIDPNLGASVYIDVHTGPISIHGTSGITKFTYTIKKDGKEVNKGEGQITDQYEDPSQFTVN